MQQKQHKHTTYFTINITKYREQFLNMKSKKTKEQRARENVIQKIEQEQNFPEITAEKKN